MKRLSLSLPVIRWSVVGRRSLIVLIAAALLVVIGSSPALSFQSLVGWAEESLRLTGVWPYLVPISLDAAALLCVGLTFWAAFRGEAAGTARALIWVFAAGSALANWRHGVTISPDAAVFLPAMPLVAALLLDVVLRRARRSILADLGALEPPLPRFRVARWIVLPIETVLAWRVAVRDGLTSPTVAIDRARVERVARKSAKASDRQSTQGGGSDRSAKSGGGVAGDTAKPPAAKPPNPENANRQSAATQVGEVRHRPVDVAKVAGMAAEERVAWFARQIQDGDRRTNKEWIAITGLAKRTAERDIGEARKRVKSASGGDEQDAESEREVATL